ncbi:MAG: hypothetical protein AB7S39_02285 [Gemmatimonadales bacterium]
MSVAAIIIAVAIASSIAGRSGRRWRRGRWGGWDDGADAEIAQLRQELEHRAADLDLLHQRVAELENRLDFTERLLASGHAQENHPTG